MTEYVPIPIPPYRREHVQGMEWTRQLGTDYWLVATNEGLLTGVTNEPVLSDRGWTVTGLSFVAGTAADFITSGDTGESNALQFTDQGDTLQSLALFGDYFHAYAAQQILGYLPTKLSVEFVARWTVNNKNDVNTGFGLIEAGGTVGTGADQMASIGSNGTNFTLRNGAGTTDTGAAVDTAWHTWRIDTTSTGFEWFIDDVSQGTVALQADLWPASIGAIAENLADSNRFRIHSIHVWYS